MTKKDSNQAQEEEGKKHMQQEKTEPKPHQKNKKEESLEATLSTLFLSLASSATISMGLAQHPSTKKVEKNLKMAQFNIDLLVLLEKKTKNNLLPEEKSFLRSIINDLQMKFVQAQSQEKTQ